MFESMIQTGFALQPETTGEDIRYFRKKHRLTQKQFACLVGTSVPTVERWEASNQTIRGPIGLMITMLLQQPEFLEKYEIPPKNMPVRMWYMFREQPCTLIDVDEARRKVKIVNYADHVQFCAFGSNQRPDFEDYEEFLRSRCFPETRDKIKLTLKELGIPFYDPMMIIEKTEGRLEEDEFWIRVEK